MKKIYPIILIIFLMATSGYGEQNYDTIVKKFEASLQQVKSYKTQSDSYVNDDKTSVLLEFVKPAMQRQTVDSFSTKDVSLFIKDKRYALVPGTNKWAQQEWVKGTGPIKDLGPLEQVLDMMKKSKPTNIEQKTLDDANYIVLEYTDVPDFGNIHLAFSKYNSTIRFYIDAASYRLKLAIVDMSGSHIDTKKKLQIRQTNKFEGYNEELDIAPPRQEDVFIAEPVSTKLPAEIFQSQTKEFKNNAYNVALQYPEDWYVKENIQDDVYQLFISKEKVEKPGDVYLTGLGVYKIYNANKRTGIKSTNAADVAKEWLPRYINSIRTSKTVITVFANSPVKVGKDTGYMTEFMFTDKYGRMLSSFHIILFKDDTFVTVIMESTQQDFDRYRKMFVDLLKDMKVF